MTSYRISLIMKREANDNIQMTKTLLDLANDDDLLLISKSALTDFFKNADYRCIHCTRRRLWRPRLVGVCGIAHTIGIDCLGCIEGNLVGHHSTFPKYNKNGTSSVDQKISVELVYNKFGQFRANQLICPQINIPLLYTNNIECVKKIDDPMFESLDDVPKTSPKRPKLHWYGLNLKLGMSSMGTAIGGEKARHLLASMGVKGSSSWDKSSLRINSLLCQGIIKIARRIVLDNVLEECLLQVKRNFRKRIFELHRKKSKREREKLLEEEFSQEEKFWREFHQLIQSGAVERLKRDVRDRVMSTTSKSGVELEAELTVEYDKAIKQWLEKHDRRTQVGITVEYDGAWQKRGTGKNFDSKSGHVVAFGGLSGKIVGFGVYSKYCGYCVRFTDESGQVAQHFCPKNKEEDDSSGSFEPAGAVDLLEQMYRSSFGKVYWQNVVTDDDATTRAYLSDMGVSIAIYLHCVL